ncbi:SIMPL domain-containing protein [Flavobacterium sp.]|uniref:SIMPL domain-containing protein n=1 Tax=Flavobacterium sp. TaxID=239 RepID=UPI00286DAFA9|nr:SIMPL domain-containing protein [Flavobacterium sp.]
MKNLVLILISLITMMSEAQESKVVTPMINVSGEGKVFTAPDLSCITVSVETKGKNSTEVKKLNDEKIEAVLNFIKKSKIPTTDFKTHRVSLNTQYDYETKKHSFIATQSIEINLKDLSKYDALMEGMVNAGVNQINSVEFKSSKMVALQSEARKLAMKEAKLKAEDYVSVLGQKVGKAILISDNSQTFYPQPMYAQMKSMDMAESAPRETLAVGEIAIVANVTVSFSLD